MGLGIQNIGRRTFTFPVRCAFNFGPYPHTTDTHLFHLSPRHSPFKHGTWDLCITKFGWFPHSPCLCPSLPIYYPMALATLPFSLFALPHCPTLESHGNAFSNSTPAACLRVASLLID